MSELAFIMEKSFRCFRTNRIAYDIFGNTVNIAERMQTNCQPGKVNISESTYHQINLFFNTINRGEIPTKNTGDINMFL